MDHSKSTITMDNFGIKEPTKMGKVYQKPLVGSEHLEGSTLILIFTLSGIFGLISGVLLYKLEK